MKTNKKAVLALGSNIGNRRENLVSALVEISEIANIYSRSKIYQTPPWGFEEQREFLNATVAIETFLNPFELLEFCRKTEIKLGRVKSFQNAPRTLDIDIIFYEDSIIDEEDLKIPHPRWSERDFVITPLLDLFSLGVFESDAFKIHKEFLSHSPRKFSPFSSF